MNVSMYSAILGRNPLSEVLKNMLNLDGEDGEFLTGRFRDIFLSKDGERILLYTRNGAGNRDCWGLKGCRDGEHDPECMVSVIRKLQSHPNYIDDYEDDFDCTYATFEFRVPEALLDITRALAPSEDPKTIHQRFDKLITKLKENVEDEETSRALALGRKIFRAIKKGEQRIEV